MRVSFAGGGSDVPPFVRGVGGRIVGAAVDIRVRATVEPFDSGWVRIETPVTGRVTTRRRGEPARSDLDFRLVEAALAEVGIEDGARVVVDTDIVPGAGLGGSSAAAVALLRALWASLGPDDDEVEDAWRRERSSPGALAEDACRIERVRLKIAGGPQDPAFAAFGGALDMRFDERGLVGRRALLAPVELLQTLSAGLVLVDTHQRRVSGDVLSRIAPMAATESASELVAAASEVARGFTSGSLERVLAGMRRSAAAKAKRDPAGSAHAIELDARLAPLGARLVRACGAGGGGHILVWAPPETHTAIEAAVAPWTIRKPALCASGVRLEA